jgi:tetratricopeptide (TPR) repeat protein
MQIAGDATIFVSKGAFVELRSDDRRVSLIREGSYTVKTITKIAASLSRPGLIEVLSSKIKSLIKGSDGESAVLGVRASDAAASFGFMTGGDEARIRGEAAMEAGDYESAQDEFEYALDEALPGEEGPLRTQLAMSLAMLDRPAAALAVLQSGEQDENPARFILEATLLVSIGEPESALAIITEAFAADEIQTYNTTDPKELQHYAAEAAELEGLALEALEKPREAAEAYRRSILAAPDSTAAQRSRQRLTVISN